MKKHIIDLEIKCQSCDGTGLYVGLGEKEVSDVQAN